ncbi:MAG TPA: glycosyl hydrolase-related protein [Chloroflexota bacterium]|nr:glycosyl hydrolase-related protein [Chloroflexota bacterium]
MTQLVWQVVPTGLVARTDSGPRQVVEVHLTVPESASLPVRLEVVPVGPVSTVRAVLTGVHDLGAPPPGQHLLEVRVPVVDAPVDLDCTLVVAGERHGTQQVRLRPVRPWRVYLVHHTHTDVGFTHPPSEVVRLHDRYLDEVLELCRATDDWPDDARFRWTCEVSWQVQNYERHRSPAAFGELLRRARSDRLEVAAFYLGIHTDLCGAEELVRSLYHAAALRRRHHVPVQAAMVNDVPGVTWGFAQVLARARIRYLSVADNNFVAPFLAYNAGQLPRPFRWQAPDGSNVLTWYTDDPYWAYIEAKRLGFAGGHEEVRVKLPPKLEALEASGYPYAGVPLLMAADNRPPEQSLAHTVRAWNERWLVPRVRLATISDFFRDVEQEAASRGRDFPTVGADWTNWWSAIATGWPPETALTRRATQQLHAGEKIWSLARLAGSPHTYPSGQIGAAYDDLLTFDEHSGSGGMWTPKSPDEAAQAVEEGFGYGYDAAREAKSVLDTGVRALSVRLETRGRHEGLPLVVVNALSWARSGPVVTDLPGDAPASPWQLIDDASGDVVAHQTTTGGALGPPGRLVFIAEDVPALGYRTYRLASAPDAQLHPDTVGDTEGGSGPAPRAGGAHLEHDTLRVQFDRETGEVVGVFATALGRDVLDPQAEHRLASFVRYRAHRDRRWRPGDPGAHIHQFPDLYEGVASRLEQMQDAPAPRPEAQWETGPVAAAVTFGGIPSTGTYPDVRRTYRLYRGQPWLEVELEVARKEGPESSEIGYVTFPFAVPDSRFRFDAPLAIVEPEAQQIAGTCRDFFAVQQWLDASNQEWGVLLSAPDVALLDLGGPHFEQYLRTLEPAQAHVWARVGRFHHERPGSASPYSRGQAAVFRFAVAPHDGPFDPRAAARFGWGYAQPLVASWVRGRQQGPLPRGAHALCVIQPDGVQAVTLKQAEDGDALVVRLWEQTGQSIQAHVRVPGATLVAARRLTVTEDPGEPLTLDDDHSVHVSLGPWELTTVLLTFEQTDVCVTDVCVSESSAASERA